MLVRMTIDVEVDEGRLAEHDGEREPPPNDVYEWWGGDLEAAIRAGICEIKHEELTVELPDE